MTDTDAERAGDVQPAEVKSPGSPHYNVSVIEGDF